MISASSAISPPRTALPIRVCSSSSVKVTADIGQLLGMLRFVQQDFERGKVGIPFDQGRHRGKPPESFGIEFPDRLRYAGAVIVDQDIYVLGSVMAGEMDLADHFGRQCVEVAERVEAEVSGADVDVVDIEEDAAAGPPGDFGQKFRLGDG